MHDALSVFITEEYPEAIKIEEKALKGFPSSKMYGTKSICCAWEFKYKDKVFYLVFGDDFPNSQPVVFVNKKLLLKVPHVEEEGRVCWTDPNIQYEPAKKEQYIHEAIRKTKNLLDEETGWYEEEFKKEMLSYWERTDSHDNKSPITLLDHVLGTKEIYAYDDTICLNSMLIASSDRQRLKSFLKNVDIDIESADNIKQIPVIELSQRLLPQDFPLSTKGVVSLIEKFATNYSEAIKLLNRYLGYKNGMFPIIFTFKDEQNLHITVWLHDIKEPLRKQGFRKSISDKKALKLKKNDFMPVTTSSVEYYDEEWVYTRGGRGDMNSFLTKNILLIGCGSLGAGVAKLLIQSGVRNITFIDNDIYSTDNIMRHELGIEYIGWHKATALADYFNKSYSGIVEAKGIPSLCEDYIFKNSDFYQEYDLILDLTANRQVMSSLNSLFIENDYPPIVFGWIEAYAFIGHTLAITDRGGCLECGFIKGKFIPDIVTWNENTQTQLPACGVTYQSYGMSDIVPIQAMIVRLVLDILKESIKRSEHRTWIGNIDAVGDLDGEIRAEAIEYYDSLEKSYFEIKKDWKVRHGCICNL